MKDRNKLNIHVDELELSVRCHNCLQAKGIRTIGKLLEYSESEMLKIKNFGRKSLEEIIYKLRKWRVENER